MKRAASPPPAQQPPRTGRYLLWLILVPAAGAAAVLGYVYTRPVTAKVVSEVWQGAYLQGMKIGHTHTVTRDMEEGGVRFLRTTRKVELTVKRYGAVMPVAIEQGCDETAEGKVLAMWQRQALAGDEMTTRARADGPRLLVSTNKGRETAAPMWDPRCLGLYAQEQSFAREKVAAGSKFELASYELSAMMPLTLRATVKGMEDTEVLAPEVGPDGKQRAVSKPARLLRADVTSDKLRVGGTEVQLPSKAVWLDEGLQPVREQYEFPGLGMVTQYTLPKELAEGRVEGHLLPDLGLSVMIPLNRALPEPSNTRQITYRVKLKDGISPPFVADGRQHVGGVREGAFELRVRVGGESAAPAPGVEYSGPSALIDSDAEVIKGMAREAAGGQTSAAGKALAMERFVKSKMRFSSAAGFPSASRIAKGLEGDCRQHSMLLAALLRAEGIPSRTALGLVYFDDEGSNPRLAFHMWVEAYVDGRWMPLDGVVGKGRVAADHLKMAEASWSGSETLAPLLPIAQALGKLEVEIVEAR